MMLLLETLMLFILGDIERPSLVGVNHSTAVERMTQPTEPYSMPVYYQPVHIPHWCWPQVSNEFWSSRFPFYIKPRTYSPNNHLDDTSPNCRLDPTCSPDNWSDRQCSPDNCLGRQCSPDNRLDRENSLVLTDYFADTKDSVGSENTRDTRYTTDENLKSYTEDVTTKENIIIVHPSDYVVEPKRDEKAVSLKSNRRSMPQKTKSTRHFSCKYCDKDYMSLGALKMHIRTHTLPCKCKICGKAFSRPWLLQGHIRTHTGERPFSCWHCGRAFADRSNLRAHLQTHSDVKKYECAKCSRTFSRMTFLTKHKELGCFTT